MLTLTSQVAVREGVLGEVAHHKDTYINKSLVTQIIKYLSKELVYRYLELKAHPV